MSNVTDINGSDLISSAPKEWAYLFCAGTLYAGPAPEERHLIGNFMVHGSTIALAADGGVGKTYVILELAMRAAAGPSINGEPNLFMGFPVLEKCNVLVLTMEDSKDDIHRRICKIDPDGKLRDACKDHCMIIPVLQYFTGGLVLAEKDSKGNYGSSQTWKSICNQIRKLQDLPDYKNKPWIVIIDTYSATHHADENSATGTNEWFRAANALNNIKATLVVTHHVRKTDPRYEIRTPADMRTAVRGSNAFMNSVRTCYGIWRMPNSDAVTKQIKDVKHTHLFNMGILKNNTGINWDDRSDPKYPEPMITLRRGDGGQLIYDTEIHEKRLELAGDKEKRLAERCLELRAAILFACRWYAEHQSPLNKTNLTREKQVYLPSSVNQLGYKNVIEPMISKLLSEGWIKEIKLQGSNGHVFDVANGPYSGGLKAKRISVTPKLPWNDYEYDPVNNEYVIRLKS